jgi:glucokinase
VPGLVDRQGVLRYAPNLREIVGLAVKAGIEARVPDARVWVGNDATCAGWAEHVVGVGRGQHHLLMVTLGTGIGGGLVSDGRLLIGANGFAGEIGHMVVDPDGPLCPCGNRGCWERFASGSGLAWLAQEAGRAGHADRVRELAGGNLDAVRGEHVTRAASEGDADAIAIMGRFGWWLALGLANLSNALDPELIVIGGGLVEAGEVLLGPVRREFVGLVEAAAYRPAIQIRPAQLGERAGAVGAGLLAADSK